MKLFAALVACASGATLDYTMRSDGEPVTILSHEEYVAERNAQLQGTTQYPFKPFSDKYVAAALKKTVDWRKQGIVTPAKDQGNHGFCGTFARVAVAESQFARLSGKPAQNFSVQQMVDCVGWDLDQGAVITDGKTGFIPTELYPYNQSCATPKACDMDPPVPGNPCQYDALKYSVVPLSDGFTNTTAVPISGSAGIDQLAAFIHHNGPGQAGIYAQVFGRRDNATCGGVGGGCWVTRESCLLDDGKNIDHSVTIVGYGTDKAVDPKTGKAYGDYWLIKNSWSLKFADQGFVKIARGVNCGNIEKQADVDLFTYGDAAAYYEQ
jgi:hypothetical protein